MVGVCACRVYSVLIESLLEFEIFRKPWSFFSNHSSASCCVEPCEDALDPRHILYCLGSRLGSQTHGVVDMYDAGVCAAEQLDPGLDEFVKEVHVLQSPTLDGDVKATRFGQVSFVDADDPETVVSP